MIRNKTRPSGRRAAVGVLAGIAPGLVLVTTLGTVGLVLGPAFGLLYALAFRSNASVLDGGLSGAAVAVPGWALVEVTMLPLLRGSTPLWTPATLGTLVPALGTWLAAGALLGLSVTPLTDVAERLFGPVPREGTGRAGDADQESVTRIVVLGGGFVGLSAARRFEELFGPDPSVELLVVSTTNATLFTPMLPESPAEASGRHTSPVRSGRTSGGHRFSKPRRPMSMSNARRSISKRTPCLTPPR